MVTFSSGTEGASFFFASSCEPRVQSSIHTGKQNVAYDVM